MQAPNDTLTLTHNSTERQDLYLYVLSSGRHQSSPSHEWGPGVRNHFQLHHVMRGRGVYRCRGRQFALEEGDTFLIYPETSICYQADKNEPWDCIWVGFDGKYAAHLLDLTDFTPSEPVFKGRDSDILRVHIESIQSNQGLSPWDRLEMNGHLCSLLAFLMRSSIKSKETDVETDCAVMAAEYIKTHFEEPISVDRLAALMSVSHSSLYRRFLKRFNMSPKQFITMCRIERACILLEEANCTVQEISNSVGFEDPFYFSRAFKSVKGIPPKQYAKRARQKKAQGS